MKAALYARVSTANHGQDPQLQTREMREYCERRGWQIADEYTDDSFYVDINSHQSLTQPVAGGVKEQYRMNKIDGTWRVVSLVRAP